MTQQPSNLARGDWRRGLPAAVPPDVREMLSPARAIQFDSRQVEPGDVFVCIPGDRADGHSFARSAVERGATALVCLTGREAEVAGLGVPVVAVADPRATLAQVAAAHEDYPAKKMTVIGVTGTDGKSTTCFFVLAALEGARIKAGLLTTIECRIAGTTIPNPTRLTSQEAPFVQRLLAEMVEAGCTHAVVEATSIGLELHRLDACDFRAAIFTNLTPDHLDYHGTVEAYRKAKGRLFEMLPAAGHGQSPGVAVINFDDKAGRYMASRTKARVITYSLKSGDADVLTEDVMLWDDGSTFALTADEEDESVECSVRLPGDFNVANAAAAITCVTALGIDVGAAAMGVAACAGIPGRMERISGAPFAVVVDYAHTGDALTKATATLREVTNGRLIAVFGCAGERGKERRTGMGEAAARGVDFTILTDEDPRSEASADIIEDIAQAMVAAGAVEGEQFERIPDRRAAIARAFEIAQPGDLVLVAGKGHETTIEYASGAVPFDDRVVAREEIARRFG
ncbi:MAG: UDP-N-acetylmuramoyl-L-alanyl-D-glutamate--2,6-diaminopimelate ligase [Dehalococcoidia bacterium]|nr:MAG: UDP-N-acetylmuramoyl-L-alanyl-D-glutamate--2,6-diaminopimelate ligase [Dehalococcoidia bacterium]